MADLALAAVVIALLAERFLAERRHGRERQALTNAVVARHPGELIALQRATEPTPRPRDRDGERVDRTVIGL